MDEVQDEGFRPYRAVSKAAVLSLALGLLSILSFVSVVLLMVAFVGMVSGLLAMRALARYPSELTGKPIAILGLIVSTAVFIGGAAQHSYEYVTEVPEGHARISFADLQPDKQARSLPIPPSALKLNNREVFIKGYVYPDGQQHNIRRFILVPDMGTCCFGGQPKITDMIEVTLEDPLRIEYSYKKRGLAGVLKVDPRAKPVEKLGGVYYQLTADFVK